MYYTTKKNKIEDLEEGDQLLIESGGEYAKATYIKDGLVKIDWGFGGPKIVKSLNERRWVYMGRTWEQRIKDWFYSFLK